MYIFIALLCLRSLYVTKLMHLYDNVIQSGSEVSVDNPLAEKM